MTIGDFGIKALIFLFVFGIGYKNVEITPFDVFDSKYVIVYTC